MRLEFVVVIGIVLLMHSIFLGIYANREIEGENEVSSLTRLAFLAPLITLLTSIPTFIVVGLLYWWLY